MIDRTRIAGLVLAGGLSSRMGGGQKGLRLLDGKPMLAHVIARLAPQVGALALNANGPASDYAEFGLPVVADSIPGHPGPLAGILAGLDWAAETPGLTHLATAATDTPFLPSDLVARLAGHEGGPVIARSAAGIQPVVGLWPLRLREDLAQWLTSGGARAVRAWAARHDPAWCDFAEDPDLGLDPFFNVNTPEDLARAAAALGG